MPNLQVFKHAELFPHLWAAFADASLSAWICITSSPITLKGIDSSI